VGRFEPGELKAVVYSGGMEAARHIVGTSDIAVKLALALDDMGAAPVEGDLVFLRTVLTGSYGRSCRTAAGRWCVSYQHRLHGPGSRYLSSSQKIGQSTHQAGV
jgi:hypothetical protein